MKLYMIPGGKAVVTASGVFRLRDGKWTGKPEGSGWKTAGIGNDGLWTSIYLDAECYRYEVNWWYERGINSLQILSFLKAAYYMTNDQKFEKAYESLIRDHHYDLNMVQQKMYGPFDINHSDDELSFLPYYILFRYAVKPIPTPERGISKWNSNTYIYDTGSDGASEYNGAFFLLPYWMGRYHGVLVEKQ